MSQPPNTGLADRLYSHAPGPESQIPPGPCGHLFGMGGSIPHHKHKRGSFMSTCHKPNGRNICFYPTTHWGYSDWGGVLAQNREKEQQQVIKNIISRLQATPEPYKHLDLLSQLRPVLKPPSGNQHLTRLLISSFQFLQYTQHTSQS